MPRRPSTTCLPLLALLIALTLLSHDAVMAVGPHNAGTGAHAGEHGDHGDHDPASDDTACGDLVAARTNDASPDLDVAAVPGDAMVWPFVPATDRSAGFGDLAVAPSAPSRSMLQVWLN